MERFRVLVLPLAPYLPMRAVPPWLSLPKPAGLRIEYLGLGMTTI